MLFNLTPPNDPQVVITGTHMSIQFLCIPLLVLLLSTFAQAEEPLNQSQLLQNQFLLAAADNAGSGNYVASPASISDLLAILALAADNRTFQRLRQHLKSDVQSSEELAKELRLNPNQQRQLGPNLGIRVEANRGYGVTITEVTPKSTADQMGIKKGDLLFELGGISLLGPKDLIRPIQATGSIEIIGYDFSKSRIFRKSIEKHDLLHSDPDGPIVVSRCVAVQKGMIVNSQFKKRYQELFKGEVLEVDFRANPSDARHTLNDWVKQATVGKIEQLLHASDVSINSSALILTTTYFHDQWAIKFKETLKSEFHSAFGTAEVNMMSTVAKVSYATSSDGRIVVLPFKSGQSFVVYLPPAKGENSNKPLRSAVKSVYRLLKIAKEDTVEIRLPRFSLQSRVPITSILADSGYRFLVDSNAQWNLLNAAPVEISGLLQEVSIEIDEQGVRAGAASAAVFSKSMPIEFHADRPFAFFVMESNKPRNVLFVGQYTSPKK